MTQYDVQGTSFPGPAGGGNTMESISTPLGNVSQDEKDWPFPLVHPKCLEAGQGSRRSRRIESI